MSFSRAVSSASFFSSQWGPAVVVLAQKPFAGGSYSSVGQSVRLITVRSAVQARVGALFSSKLSAYFLGIGPDILSVGSMAEWSKALALGASP